MLPTDPLLLAVIGASALLTTGWLLRPLFLAEGDLPELRTLGPDEAANQAEPLADGPLADADRHCRNCGNCVDEPFRYCGQCVTLLP